MDDPDAAAPARFCPSRNAGRRCTRALRHPGLHRTGATLWSDLQADPARCAGSREPGSAAPRLADGFPDGRALCDVCGRFVELDADGLRVEHDTTDPDESDAELLRRREWFNSHGW